METNSIVLDKGKESFDLNKCIICQNSGSLVSTENSWIRIIEAAKIQNDDDYGRLMSLSLDVDLKYHMDNKCYKNYVLRGTWKNKGKFSSTTLASRPSDKYCVR